MFQTKSTKLIENKKTNKNFFESIKKKLIEKTKKTSFKENCL